ncbi:MAG: restriction endonuclease [Candidatus Binatia bacterium]
MNSTLREELLMRLASSDPTFFEHLIIDLMIAMGYGGAGSARHLGKTSDGGVDGVINEDPLGLDIVFLQAKRYAADNVIGVDKIREFAGSLDEKGAVKGVFVTTSHFASQAKAYAERSPKRIILIDGEGLARLLVNYGVGVRTFRTIELKKIDSDYFNTDE